MRQNVVLLAAFLLLGFASSASGQSGLYLFSTVAGSVNATGPADGTNDTAQFNFPGGIAVDAAGIVYVCDILNHTLRRVAPVGSNWVVSTVTGLAGMPGAADGTNSEATFDRPNGVALDSSGNIFVADHYNHTIRKIKLVGTNWVVTTIAGLAGVHGNDDGTNNDSRFWSPTGIAVDTAGNLFVTDTANFTIREIMPSGTNWVVSTIAGLPLNFGFADGTNTEAQFNYPYGIATDAAGNVYVADSGNNAIRQLQAVGKEWVVTTIAGTSGGMGSNDGPGIFATFNFPNSLCADPMGNVFVTDQSNDTIRKLSKAGKDWMVSTIGGATLKAGSTDGYGSDARFKHPWGIAACGVGRIYVADYGNQTIREGVFLPGLRVSLSLQRVILTWPAEAMDYVAEASSSLGADALWSGFTNTPGTNGQNLLLIDVPGSGNKFYRLKKR